MRTAAAVGFPYSRLSATMWASLLGAAGAGTAAFAGLYPQLDDGKLRPLLAVTSAFFAAPLVAWASRARSRSAAVGRMLGVACVLGVAAAVPPALVLLLFDGGLGAVIFGMLFFGVILGAPTGLAYGALLAGPAAMAHGKDGSHAATDRVQRACGVWLACVSALAAVASLGLSGRDAYGAAPTVASGAMVLVALACTGVAHRRLRRREAWIARVREGREPGFRIRVADVRDELRTLPRLESGDTVVELVAEETTAYRAAAVGTAVARV
jgi:hypothetical protein